MKQPNKVHRIYINSHINKAGNINCSSEIAHHIKNVLRVKNNEEIKWQ